MTHARWKVSGLAALGAVLAIACPAFAEDPAVTIEAVPVLASTSSTEHAIPTGWNEVLVRIQNRGSQPLRGEISISDRQYVGRENEEFEATAPFSVGANASIHVRVPVQVSLYSTLTAEVRNDAGVELSATTLSAYPHGEVTLVDVSDPSRVHDAIGDVPISPRWASPTAAAARSAPSVPRLVVDSPRFDPSTGDPILPDRAALYAPTDAVLMRSDTLVRLSGAELDALAKYVLGGGTLAVAIARPEDIRHPTLVALAGGTITAGGVSSEALAELELPPVRPDSGGKPVPAAKAASADTTRTLAGYVGGNLRGSQYGNSAAYGLGEVHLLAFDPTKKPALDDPWAQARMIDLTRRAYDRRGTIVFRPGSLVTRELNPIRKELDPNENSRWAIAAAAFLLCVYSLLAGPLNFSRASKAGKPLRALVHLPIYAAVAFAMVVGIGMATKGVRGRARHLTLVEAGAGMSEGVARRFRGFFAAKSVDLTVRTTDRSSVASSAVLSDSSEKRNRLVVDRDGARLVGVAALPWQTVVVQEDGSASLGEGIAVTRDGADELAVTNRTGRAMRGTLLRLPNGKTAYLGRIADGEKASSRAAKPVSSLPGGSKWEAAIATATTVGATSVHHLAAGELHTMLEADAPGLAEAWSALEASASAEVDWLPEGASIVLAQIDGGEGRRSDSGLVLDSDRLLVRIVGLGGAP